MSRSYLRDKYMRKEIRSWVKHSKRNAHKHDEMPKNKVSKHISIYINDSHVQWLQEPGSFGGHKVRHAGHRIVSGIVRQKIKEETRKEINNHIINNLIVNEM